MCVSVERDHERRVPGRAWRGVHHDTQPLRRARDARIEPARAAVLERKAFVEQHDVVPLRALRLVHGEHVAIVEFVVGLALLPGDGLDGAAEAVAAHRDLRHLVAKILVGRQPHGDDLGFRLRARLHPPQPAIEQALLAVVAQADQLVAGHRQRILDVLPLPHPHVVGAAGVVAADQHLVGAHDALRIEFVARHHFAFAVAADFELAALADIHRHPHDRVVLGLAMHFGQHRVGLGVGEEAAALDRRQLRGIAEHQQRAIERHQIAAELGIHHRAFVDHDQFCFRGRRVVPQFKARLLDAGFARAIDQRMDGGGVVAALVAHHQRRLAGEGGELHLAVDALGDMPRQRGLAGSGIAEQTEDRRRAVPAGLCLHPVGNGLQRGILMRCKNGHGVSAEDVSGPPMRPRLILPKLMIQAVSASRRGPIASRERRAYRANDGQCPCGSRCRSSRR